VFTLAALQQLLLQETSLWPAAVGADDLHSEDIFERDHPKHRAVLRLFKALVAGGTARASSLDLAVLVRQAIRSHRQSLTFTSDVFSRFSDSTDDVGLSATPLAGDLVEIKALSWHADWLEHSDRIDTLELRRFDHPAAGDGMVRRTLGVSTYRSEAQKAAVLACMHAPPGSVTLVTLPTGAGKSLCAQLPAWVETGGGQFDGGTTILVVPTIALAQDQVRQARQRFSNCADALSCPQIWLGETSTTERESIREGLLAGTLPLLITSPEALMQSTMLYSACEQAAARGTLSRIVIDEAHIVEGWGGGFRTDFQFLGAFHQQLLATSKGRLRLVLLSATVSESAEQLLRRLFRGNAPLRVVRANRLRPEPSYWFNVSDYAHQRHERVLEALRYLPRPAILYVTQPEVANNWVQTLRAVGYRRVAAFSGETTPEERRRINQAWQNDELDLIVATSAFGLGIDKSDVRTVVHAALPETIDRFYQEVGRGGRDGWSSISLMCLEPRDVKVPEAMLSSSVISTEKGVDRIKGMLNTMEFMDGSGNSGLIDIQAPPASRPDLPSSERNREWNEHSLLLAQRAGILTILDSRPLSRTQELDSPKVQLAIRIDNDEAVRWSEAEGVGLTALFDEARSRERQAITNTIQELSDLAQRYASGQAERCLATALSQLYPDCGLACGGCPVCRASGQQPYAEQCEVELEALATDPPTGLDQVHPGLLRLMGADRRLTVEWDGRPSIADARQLRPLLSALVRAGLRQLIVPDALATDDAWVAYLTHELEDARIRSHAILPSSWVADRNSRPVFPIPTVALYPPADGTEIDAFYRAMHSRAELRGVPVVSIVHWQLEVESLGGRFVDKVNGMPIRQETLKQRLTALRIPLAS
jgi:ATP-dependent DNA helicase RecQ